MTSSVTPSRPDLVAALADPRLASLVAEIRQGQSSTPRCEPPGAADIEIAARWIGFVCEAVALRAALASEPEPQPVTEGWQMVPIIPTQEMVIAGTLARLNTGLSTYNETPSMWRAMIAASPLPEEPSNG